MPEQKEKNPRRVAAGCRNRQLRGNITLAGLECLRQSALKNKAWEKSTGPKTAAGKARIAEGAQKRWIGSMSQHQLELEVQAAGRLIRGMAAPAWRSEEISPRLVAKSDSNESDAAD